MPAENTTVWIGIDIAKASVEAALRLQDADGPAASFARTPEGMAKLLEWAREKSGPGIVLRAIVEATGRYSIEAIAWLLAAEPALAPACVNPLHAKRFAQSLGMRNKTDRCDARMLARMGAERSPAPYEQPSKPVAELRELVHERRRLVEQRTALKCRIEEGTTSAFVSKGWKAQEASLGAAIERLEKEIDKVVEADPALRADIRRLETIPGVGRITAVTVVGELGDLRRFATSRKLSAFAGLSPRRFESGSSVRGRTRMCKQGNPAVRTVLYMSAVTTSRMEKGMKAKYEQLIEDGKHPMAALGALMRRQLVLMRAVLVGGRDYEQKPVKNSPKKAELALAT